ncbi:hypothetical protein EUTSA_v10019308mg [Eutrema salsugineum]|uniref:Uncharacterized protein n=2 Tax=Eutrema salsugineum TaxID=72664 RepID=V4KMP9_EUTSA|nr:hypothetical protein EUTSA_v10019308mg [Eutrema salsugineum]
MFSQIFCFLLHHLHKAFVHSKTLQPSQSNLPGFVSKLAVNLGGTEMGFIMEFAENLVLRLMEDPEVRDRKAREHIYEMHERCKKIKEMWALPIRPYGFWTFERHNAQLRWDPQISQVAGRRDPYDDLLEDHSSSSK